MDRIWSLPYIRCQIIEKCEKPDIRPSIRTMPIDNFIFCIFRIWFNIFLSLLLLLKWRGVNWPKNQMDPLLLELISQQSDLFFKKTNPSQTLRTFSSKGRILLRTLRINSEKGGWKCCQKNFLAANPRSHHVHGFIERPLKFDKSKGSLSNMSMIFFLPFVSIIKAVPDVLKKTLEKLHRTVYDKW